MISCHIQGSLKWSSKLSRREIYKLEQYIKKKKGASSFSAFKFNYYFKQEKIK